MEVPGTHNRILQLFYNQVAPYFGLVKPLLKQNRVCHAANAAFCMYGHREYHNYYDHVIHLCAVIIMHNCIHP